MPFRFYFWWERLLFKCEILDMDCMGYETPGSRISKIVFRTWWHAACVGLETVLRRGRSVEEWLLLYSWVSGLWLSLKFSQQCIMELHTPTSVPHGLLGFDVAQGPPHPHAQNPFKMAKGQDAAFPFLHSRDSRVNCQEGLIPFPAAQKFWCWTTQTSTAARASLMMESFIVKCLWNIVQRELHDMEWPH